MFTFIKNIYSAQSLARRVASAEAELAALEVKARNIVSHATGGALTDLSKSLNDICVEISAVKNRIFNEALAIGAERKAKELAGDLLHSMHDVERKVLVALHSEFVRPLDAIASFTNLAVNDVRAIVRGFVLKGVAEFGPAMNDEGAVTGSGYTLTDTGNEMKTRQLAADVADSAKAAA
jgi:hypothetical protein